MLSILLCLSTANSAQVPVSGRGHASNPVWSQTGTKLAYEVNDYAGKIDLYTIDITDSNPQGSPVRVKLNVATSSFSGTSGIVAGDPVWHQQRDGMLFFEASYTGVSKRIYMTNRNSPPREIIRDSVVSGDLSWSSLTPDGNSLLFTSDATGSGDIYKYEIPTQTLTQMTATDSAEMSPRLHANGSMVYTFKNAGGEDLFILENGKQRSLDKADRDQTRPVWANDKVVYFSNEKGEENWDILVTDLTGKRKKLATRVRLPIKGTPALSADKQWIAYGSEDPEKSGSIWFAKLDGSKTVEFKSGLVACGEPALIDANGRILLAFTALPSKGSDWRHLHIQDVTSVLR